MIKKHCAASFWRAPALALSGLLGAAPAAAADAYASDWVKSLKSSARLISAGGAVAGVEIQLAPGAITYWRNPGDAGLPPAFSFEGSANLAKAEPRFPAPKRIVERDATAFGYDHGVILPIDVTPSDPAKPVVLALKLNYAVCENICVPAQASLSLSLPTAADSPFAPAIAAAKSQVPRVVEWASLNADFVALEDNRWRLCLPGQALAARDAFIEAPDQWWITMSAQADASRPNACFAVALKQKPEGASLPVTARLTITGGPEPIETSLVLAQ